ncbi:MAG: hypothetical protein IKS55_02625 [Oscillospiraceae bacterium]|nr:hypothetical protein [Oscillospiraceae bacterium]
MKLIDIVNARGSLQKLAAQDLPLKTALAVVRTVETANSYLGFYGGEIAKFNPEEDPARLRELNEMEIDDFNPEKIAISTDLDGIRLSASDVKMLEPFVEFQ